MKSLTATVRGGSLPPLGWRSEPSASRGRAALQACLLSDAVQIVPDPIEGLCHQFGIANGLRYNQPLPSLFTGTPLSRPAGSFPYPKTDAGTDAPTFFGTTVLRS